MQPNILDAISNQYNSLTRSGKKLADYIFTNKTEAQYLSITSLAESSGVSEATITRFCRGLGLAGYNDFKLALAKADPTTVTGDPYEDDDSYFSDEGNFEHICRKLYQANITALNDTLALMNQTSALKAASIMSKAQRIFCFGQGSSNVMAMEAWARFSTASSKFSHISDSHMQAMATSLFTDQDVILFFSYSGATRDMVDVLKPARENGAQIILVTHFSNSPAAALSDVILLCGSVESPLQSGSIAAKMGQLFIIDYLFYAFCMQNPEECAAARSATAQATARKLL